MLTIARIAKILDRKMAQVAHKSRSAQVAYRARQEAILRAEMAMQQERAFVRACGFHSNGEPTLGQIARGQASL